MPAQKRGRNVSWQMPGLRQMVDHRDTRTLGAVQLHCAIEDLESHAGDDSL